MKFFRGAALFLLAAPCAVLAAAAPDAQVTPKPCTSTNAAKSQSCSQHSYRSIPACGRSVINSAAARYGCRANDEGCDCDHYSQIASPGAFTSSLLSACNSAQSALAVSSYYSGACACLTSSAVVSGTVSRGTCVRTTPTTSPSPTSLPPSARACQSSAASKTCASDFKAIPSCASSAVTAAGSSYGCSSNDYPCFCSHTSQYGAAFTSAILSACTNVETALQASSGISSACSCVTSADAKCTAK